MHALLLVALLLPSFAKAQADAESQALVLFDRAREAFRNGAFERSALLLEEAISLHDVAPLHYNLGRSYQELGRQEDALSEYRRFLAMEPDTPERPRVEARIAILEAQLRPEPEPEPEPDPEPEPEPEPEAEVRAGPWILLGTGVAILGGGVVAGVLSNRAEDDARNAPSQEAAEAPAERADRRARAANALFAIGGAVAITGLAWGIVDRRRARVEVQAGLGSVLVRGRF
ncbi:MAG: tetratricopeptide repeat protein [Myxococcota bacterium]